MRKKSAVGNTMRDAVIVFTDVRGFVSWADKHDVFAFIDEFGLAMQKMLSRAFPGWFIKHLGDGAMLILEVEETTTEALLKRLLIDTVRCVRRANVKFADLCGGLSIKHGSQVPLSLGWGVTKGHIKRAGHDYIGADINKSARLCDIARPFGLVIDRDDFPVLPKFPKALDLALYRQVRKLGGLRDDVNVWVTKEIATQFLTRETLRETPEVHVAGLCFKEEEEGLYALVARRASTRHYYPGLYEGCGGQLARNELFTAGAARHFRLELQIDVEVNESVHEFYSIRHPEDPDVPGICFLCTYKSGTPRSENHAEVKWVGENDIRSMSPKAFIPGVHATFLRFMDRFKQARGTPKG